MWLQRGHHRLQDVVTVERTFIEWSDDPGNSQRWWSSRDEQQITRRLLDDAFEPGAKPRRVHGCPGARYAGVQLGDNRVEVVWIAHG